jgi:hypothetical protein
MRSNVDCQAAIDEVGRRQVQMREEGATCPRRVHRNRNTALQLDLPHHSTHKICSLYPFVVIMGSVRGSPLDEGVPTERQELLSPRIALRDIDHEQNLTVSSTKLGASALNFLFSGIAMVGVGVC